MPSHNLMASVADQKTGLMAASEIPWSSSYSNPSSSSPLQFTIGGLDPLVPELVGTQSSPDTLSSTLCHPDFLSPLAHAALKLVYRRPYHQGMSPKILAEGPVLCMINKAEMDLPPSRPKQQEYQMEPVTPRSRVTFEIEDDAFSSLSSLPPSTISSTRSSFSSATISSAIENCLIPPSREEETDTERNGPLNSFATTLQRKFSYVSTQGRVAARLIISAVSAVARRRSVILNSSAVTDADVPPTPTRKPRWAVLVVWSPSETEHSPLAVLDSPHHVPILSLVLFRPQRGLSSNLRMLATPDTALTNLPSLTQRMALFLGSPHSVVSANASSAFLNPEHFKNAATLEFPYTHNVFIWIASTVIRVLFFTSHSPLFLLFAHVSAQFSTSRHRLCASVSICQPPKKDCPLSAPASPLPLSSAPHSLQLLDNQNRQTVHLCYFDLQDQLAILVSSPPRPSSTAGRSSPRFSAPFLPLHRPRRQRRRGVIPQHQSHRELEHQYQFSHNLSDFLLINHYRALLATFPFTFRS
ncbi:unnamed protein product [Schistocephalus solidus]|uniref:Uncharacterized protein n=1 Tax=Schistocephalus solidus TaxID=70667 RepID=A0A183TNB5_SCHSO|nr:unnamed protein product [Schistocephalus solidus]